MENFMGVIILIMSEKKNKKELDLILKALYYDENSPIAYTNANYIYKYLKKEKKKIKFKLKDIKNWLLEQDVYTTHSQKRLNKKYAPVYSNKPLYLFDSDTAWFSVGNSKYKKFIIFVDVFSRFTHAVPVKDIKSDSVINAFKEAFKIMKTPLKIRADRGKEFHSSSLKKFLTEQNVHVYASNIPHKSSFAERQIAHLKGLLTKLGEERGEKNWEKVLPDALRILNNRYNRSINTSPIEATKEKNRYKILNFLNKTRLLQQKEFKSKFSLELGSPIRIRTLKNTFAKSHEPSFTEQIFYIVGRKLRNNIEYYYLKNEEDEFIDGGFTLGELLPVPVSKDKEYRIEKVFNTKKIINGVKFVLVKWFGYTKKTFIPESDIRDINQNKK